MGFRDWNYALWKEFLLLWKRFSFQGLGKWDPEQLSFSFFFFFFFFFFLNGHPTVNGGSQDRAQVELKPPAYATATAMWDLSCIRNPHHSSLQCWILNPLNEAKDWTRILMDARQIRFPWSMTGTPVFLSSLILCIWYVGEGEFFLCPSRLFLLV